MRALLQAAVHAEEDAGGADVGVMPEVRLATGRLDVRVEDALFAALAEGHEHDEHLRHQRQTARKATKPMRS